MSKIECLLKRDGGSKIEIGGTEYHFKPQADGSHVAEVTEKAHIERFLSIKEAYKLIGKEQVKKETAPIEPENTIEEAKSLDASGDSPEEQKTEDSNSNDEQAKLIEEAKSLGIRANRNWSIGRLQSEIAALKAE